MHKVRRRQIGVSPPTLESSTDGSSKNTSTFGSIVRNVRPIVSNICDFLSDSRKTTPAFLCGVWVLVVAYSVLVLLNVTYTEIDWKTYMQQASLFMNGTFDYKDIYGDTGPVVYPAGFLYVYSILYMITDQGRDIFTAQCIFCGIYCCLVALVFCLYNRKVPPFAILITAFTAYRVTSLFILRLFNDGVAMFFYYVSMLLMVYNRWNLASLMYSVSVSIKMNTLLFAPGIFFFLISTKSIFETLLFIVISGITQLLLGLPFLLTNWHSYVTRAFDFGRIFQYQWTVNWQFLPQHLFTDHRFHLSLLIVQILCLLMLMQFRWRQLRSIYDNQATKYSVQRSASRSKRKALIDVLVESNFVGICCSRSLHYQFYVWYYHSLPFLLRIKFDNDKNEHAAGAVKANASIWRSTNVQMILRIGVMLMIEACWYMYPPNAYASITLTCCHLMILIIAFGRQFGK